MFDAIPSFIVGLVSFAILVVASWCVGEGGEILGKKYDASIIGGLVIAWLNTAPEAIFFITALASSNPRFAVGAVSGSTIVVCTVALGACLYIGANARASGQIYLQQQVKRQCLILGVSLVNTALISFTGFNLMLGVVGVLYYLFFITFSLTNKLPDVPDKDDEDLEVQEEEEEHDVPVYKGILYLIVGGILIFTFSRPFILSVVNAASTLRVNPILLAFFLAPVASEMPEILESISLSRKGNSQNINIAFSNLIGGTITKTTLLCGIFCFYGVSKGFEWESPSYTVALSLLIMCAGAASGIGYLVNKQTQVHGMVLFALFVITGIIQYLTNASFEDNIEIETTLT
jgi:cation:H+ antiporter